MKVFSILTELNRAERVGWKQPTPHQVLEKYRNKPNHFVHVTKRIASPDQKSAGGVKVGVHPTSIMGSDNMKGIYAWPFDVYLVNSDYKLPEGSALCVVKFNGNGRKVVTSTYNKADLQKDMKAAAEFIRNHSKLKANHDTLNKAERGHYEHALTYEEDVPPLAHLVHTLDESLSMHGSSQHTLPWVLRTVLNIGLIVDDEGWVLDPDNESREVMFTSKQSLDVVECI